MLPIDVSKQLDQVVIYSAQKLKTDAIEAPHAILEQKSSQEMQNHFNTGAKNSQLKRKTNSTQS